MSKLEQCTKCKTELVEGVCPSCEVENENDTKNNPSTPKTPESSSSNSNSNPTDNGSDNSSIDALIEQNEKELREKIDTRINKANYHKKQATKTTEKKEASEGFSLTSVVISLIVLAIGLIWVKRSQNGGYSDSIIFVAEEGTENPKQNKTQEINTPVKEPTETPTEKGQPWE